MKIGVKKKLMELLKRDEKVVVKKEEEVVSTTNDKQDSISSLKMEKYMYLRLEKVKINSNFKYYNHALTGNLKEDYESLFGINDSHGSAKVLEHSFRENYLKIQRSHDISLGYNNGVYNIYNGRHRLIYLKAFYDAYCFGDTDLGYEAPALVSYFIDDEEVNMIINLLKKDYGAKIYKGNYYDDEISFFIIIDNKLYVTKNKKELEDFFKILKDDAILERYFLSETTDKKDFLIEDIFQSIFNEIGKDLFAMSFIDLFSYINKNGVILEDRKIIFNELNVEAIYTYYLRICEGIQICKVYGYDIPNGISDITNVRSKPINVYGAIVMDFLYDNPMYQNLRWDELFKIVNKFTGFNDCDSELLKESALRYGYVEGNGIVQEKKKNYFFK